MVSTSGSYPEDTEFDSLARNRGNDNDVKYLHIRQILTSHGTIVANGDFCA